MSVDFRRATLSNGLEIIAEIDPAAHTAAIGFFVRTGARDEITEVMGVSHFLEHMMFKGTQRRSAEDVDRDFDDLGAGHNAFTTAEMTAFHAHALPEMLPAAAEILADIMRPALRDADFDDEKAVILEEIAMYDDQPFWVLYEQAMQRYYGAHPLGHRVLGTIESITAMTCDRMRAYFSERYSADNTVVALAGNVDFGRMTDLLFEHCGAWHATGTRRHHPDATRTREVFDVRLPSVSRHYTLMLAPAPAIQDDSRYAAGMLARILGGGDGSRLYWALVETGLVEDAAADYLERDGVGDYVVYVATSPEDAERTEEVARRETAQLVESLTEDDLVRARSQIATAATLAGELPAGRMQRLGRLWAYTGEYRPLERELERIDAVTLDDLRAVSEAWPIEPVLVARMGPE